MRCARPYKRRSSAAALTLSLMLLLSACTTPTPPQEQSSPEVSGELSPEPSAAAGVTFDGVDLEGNAVSADIFAQSRLTMVNVWATYCDPCLREMPGLGELAEEYDAADFQLIGIISDVMEGDDQTRAEELIGETGADYPHLLLNESIYYALLTEVSAVPTTIFLDGEGQVLGGVVGAMEKSDWKEIVDGLLEEL